MSPGWRGIQTRRAVHHPAYVLTRCFSLTLYNVTKLENVAFQRILGLQKCKMANIFVLATGLCSHSLGQSSSTGGFVWLNALLED